MISQRDIIYTPPEIGNLVLDTINERRKNPGAGIRFGVADVDKKLLPLRPGELITIVGRPSNYKSGLMGYWSRRIADQLVNEDNSKEVVVFVTWEMAIEEMALYDLAAVTKLNAAEIAQGRIDDDAWESLQKAAMKRSARPLWLVGHSMARRKRRPRLSLTNIAEALMWLEDNMDIRPRAIFLDYLQVIDSDEGETRRMQVWENVYRCKDMALAMGCPVIVGVQASRSVDERKWKLPSMRDGQETSNIEQASDKMLSVWMPKTSEQENTALQYTYNHKDVLVTENLLVLGLLKQKLGPAGMWWPLYVDPTRNEIGAMQVEEPRGWVPN